MSGNKAELFLKMLREDDWEEGMEGNRGRNLKRGKMRAKMEIRSLMNIRMPREVSEEMLEAQDAYLQEELEEKGVVSLAEIPAVEEQYGSSHPLAGRISIWQGDITRLKTGAIVNAANSQLLGCFVPCHRCIDNAIHSAAGMQLREECNRIMERRRMRYGDGYEEPAGTATLTKSYNLPCDYVIHTKAGRIWGTDRRSL